MTDVITVFTVAVTIITVGFLANLIFKKTGFSDTLFLILIGLIFGPIVGLFSREDLLLVMPVFTALTLALILFQGGLDVNIYAVLSQGIRSTILASLYVLSATFFTMLFGHFALGLRWIEALMLGPMTTGTSSIVVIPLVSKLNVADEVKAVLSLESTLTDVLNIILVTVFLEIYLIGSFDIRIIFSQLIEKFILGIVFGAIVGIIWIKILEIIRRQEYTYMLTLATLIMCYAGAEYLGGSGALSALAFGAMLGMLLQYLNPTEEGFRFLDLAFGTLLERLNLQHMHDLMESIEKFRSFQTELTFLVRAIFFLFLGLIYTPNIAGVIYAGAILGINLAIRKLAVDLSTYRSNLHEYGGFMTFMCGTGLAEAVLSLMVYNELTMRQIAIAPMYPLIVTNIIILNNIITSLAPLILKRHAT
ncbi:cation:proton antiporter [Candidatus Bathyarchaeota archaeon]|nr:cation:proton antiporter [Candidatus Bathyarchaeota archaeon]MBS7613952.1 cation:proton antiporter [Candidatus Bathyarchaeota archaeon]MBS7618698.1 cation:proton antiporter [Candidatus Bathyarchaeota archaeon]